MGRTGTNLELMDSPDSTWILEFRLLWIENLKFIDLKAVPFFFLTTSLPSNPIQVVSMLDVYTINCHVLVQVHIHVSWPQPPDDVHVDTGPELRQIQLGTKSQGIRCLAGILNQEQERIEEDKGVAGESGRIKRYIQIK